MHSDKTEEKAGLSDDQPPDPSQFTSEIISDIDEVKSLWKKWVSPTSLFDTWEFRFSFWQGYHYRPHFILVKSKTENIGLLPLWYEDDHDKYAFFGSYWQEDNRIITTSPKYISALLSFVPEKTELIAILPSSVPKEFHPLFSGDSDKYILSLTNLHSSDDYLQSLKKKKRYNIKHDYRLIQAQNPQVVFDHFDNFEDLVQLSKRRFAEKEEKADWLDPRRVETFRSVIKNGISGDSYKVRMITIKIGDKIAAVDLIALFQDTYYAVKCAYDVSAFSGIGNYINIFEIDDAISLKCKKMDFLQLDYGWKDGWFQSVPLLKYVK